MTLGWLKMQGTYKLIQNGEVLIAKNVITNNGKASILDAVAGKSAGFASSIVVGIGDTAATANDTALEYAISGNDVNAVIVDYVNEKIFFKATLPSNDSYEIHELGCFSINYTGAQNAFGAGNIVLVNFDENVVWNDSVGTSTRDATHSRVGTTSVQYSSFSSAKGYMELFTDLSILPSTATFDLAYYTNGASSVKLRFKADDANYYEGAYVSSNGYHINKLAISSFTATGTPSWANITQLEVEAAGTSATIALDTLRYTVSNQSEAINANLLSHVILDTPQRKLPGVSMDVEYMLELSI